MDPEIIDDIHVEKIRGIFSKFDIEVFIEKWGVIALKMLIIYLILLFFVYLERRLFKRALIKREAHLHDKTNIIFIRNVVVYTTYGIGFLSIIYQIPGLQKMTNTLLAGAGILAAAIGFGSQQAISNIVSGIFMVIFKPFRIGDFIDLGNGTQGTVIDISLRHTTIQNPENRMIIVPNPS